MTEARVTLVDTSAAVALVLADHEAHTSTWDALAERPLGLAGHAWFETYSVLTRLPGASRRDGATVASLLDANFTHTRFLEPAATVSLTTALARKGIEGGAVYDALIAEAARSYELVLASRDRRALDTYRVIGAEVELLT